MYSYFQRQHGKSVFNLNNDDDDVTLTHFGQSLSEIEKFEDPERSDDEDGYRDGESERGKLGGEWS